ncbi:MAG: MBL fold metallo-hydrolase, partial [Candidatus Diapherotrites archaeon]
MDLQFLGHSFFKISGKDCTMLLDPLSKFTPRPDGSKPLFKAPAKLKPLKDLGLILVSHEHTDHFDKGAIEKIAQQYNACVVGHESVLSELNLPRNLLRAVSTGDCL